MNRLFRTAPGPPLELSGQQEVLAQARELVLEVLVKAREEKNEIVIDGCKELLYTLNEFLVAVTCYSISNSAFNGMVRQLGNVYRSLSRQGVDENGNENRNENGNENGNENENV